MKKLFLLTFLSTAMLWTGCSDDDENTIVPAELQNIQAVSEAPGQITLSWDYPEDLSTIKYVRVKYYDPYTGQNINKLTSTYSNSMIVENTRAKYGEYTFTLQPFSPSDTGGEVYTVHCTSQPAQATASEVTLTAANLSTCHINTAVGDGDDISALLDGSTDTYFSTITTLSFDPENNAHYLQVTLPDGIELTDFQFSYATRNHAGGKPVWIELYVSNEGPTANETHTSWISDGHWTKLGEIQNDLEGDNWRNGPLPVGNAASYMSEQWSSDTPFKHFRMRVMQAKQSANGNNLQHFFLSEFRIYQIVDPEAE